MKGIKLILLGIAIMLLTICTKIVFIGYIEPGFLQFFYVIVPLIGFSLTICGFFKKDAFGGF